MASSSNLSTDITSLIVEYFERKALQESEFQNGLLKYGKKGIIPEKNSKVIHWHRWSKFSLASDLTEGQEPSSGVAMDATDIECELLEFGDYVEIPLFSDAIRLDSAIQEAYPKFTEQAQRTANRRIMSNLAAGAASGNNNFDAASKLYAGGAGSFGELTSNGTNLSSKDIQRAVGRCEMNQAKRPIVCLINPWNKMDLMKNDAEFRGLLAHGGSLNVLINNNLAEWAGAKLDLQDEPWRENVEGTYAASGSVITTYVFGGESYGTAQLMGKTGLKPKFHVQNISVTGRALTIGYRIPFKAATLNANWIYQLKSVASDASVASVS